MEYDTRLGRRWNIDPKPQMGVSNYSANGNNPIWASDPNGDFDTRRDARRYKHEHGLNGRVKRMNGGYIISSKNDDGTRVAYRRINATNGPPSHEGRVIKAVNILDQGHSNSAFSEDAYNQRYQHYLKNKFAYDRYNAAVSKADREIKQALAIGLGGSILVAGAIVTAPVWVPAVSTATLSGLPAGGADLVLQLAGSNGDFKQINPVSTLSAIYLKNPFLSASPGQFINASYNNFQNGNILQPINSKTVYSVLLNSAGNIVGDRIGLKMNGKNELGSYGEFIGQMLGGAIGTVGDQVLEME